MLNVKEAIQDMGGADVVAKLIPGRRRTLSTTGPAPIGWVRVFYLRFLELCNKMKINVDPIKVMNGDKMTDYEQFISSKHFRPVDAGFDYACSESWLFDYQRVR